MHSIAAMLSGGLCLAAVRERTYTDRMNPTPTSQAKCGFCGTERTPEHRVIPSMPHNWQVLVCVDCHAILAGVPLTGRSRP